jgi:NitT/TauT family transport system permease protein
VSAPASAVAGPGRGRARMPAQRLAAHLFTLAALAAWAVYALFVPAYQVPGPLPVAARILDFLTEPYLAKQLLRSLAHVLGAIALSFAAGCALAFAAHYLRLTRFFIDDQLTPFLNAFSGIGWLFLGILWFGVNSITVVFAVTMILTPFAIINIRTGLAEADRELDELGRSLTRELRRRFTKLTLPMLLPYLFATLRISFGVSWKVVLTAELFGGNAGVGYLLNVARQEFDTETIFAIIGFIILFVYLAEMFFFAPMQRRLKERFGHAD